MNKVKLTQGKFALVSDIDFEYLSQWKWHYNSGYAVRSVQYKTVFMHKVILARMGITLKKRLKIKDKLDYHREVFIPPLDLLPGPKEIPLTQGKVALVDFEDYEYLMQWNWGYSNGYAARSIQNKTIWLHRIVAERMRLDLSGTIDHKNRDRLNDQRGNLRAATQAQQSQNSSMYLNNTSGYKGVSWNRAKNKWRAYINVNCKRKYLGYFKVKEEAHDAYRKAAKKYHGEFACE